MKAVLLVVAFLGQALGLEWNHEFSSELLKKENMLALFQSWRFHHSKVYESIEEEIHRFSIFESRMQRIAASNDLHHLGQKTYTLRMNHFGDLSDEEFHDMYNSPSTELAPKLDVNQKLQFVKREETPLTEGATVDWVAQGKVTPVKDQGMCGSCYAFSATGSMECNYAIAHKSDPIILSDQQLVDCSLKYGNSGCSGGWYWSGWKYAQDAGGLCTAVDYPYTAIVDSCKQNSCGHKYNAPLGYEAIGWTEHQLQDAVDKGCVSIAIEADQFAFSHYSGGVLDGDCGDILNHAVLVTGYGVMDGMEYWMVKNSYSANWGVNGYVYLCKNCDKNGWNGQCGITEYPYQVLE